MSLPTSSLSFPTVHGKELNKEETATEIEEKMSFSISNATGDIILYCNKDPLVAAIAEDNFVVETIKNDANPDADVFGIGNNKDSSNVITMESNKLGAIKSSILDTLSNIHFRLSSLKRPSKKVDRLKKLVLMRRLKQFTDMFESNKKYRLDDSIDGELFINVSHKIAAIERQVEQVAVTSKCDVTTKRSPENDGRSTLIEMSQLNDAIDSPIVVGPYCPIHFNHVQEEEAAAERILDDTSNDNWSNSRHAENFSLNCNPDDVSNNDISMINIDGKMSCDANHSSSFCVVDMSQGDDNSNKDISNDSDNFTSECDNNNDDVNDDDDTSSQSDVSSTEDICKQRLTISRRHLTVKGELNPNIKPGPIFVVK